MQEMTLYSWELSQIVILQVLTKKIPHKVSGIRSYYQSGLACLYNVASISSRESTLHMMKTRTADIDRQVLITHIYLSEDCSVSDFLENNIAMFRHGVNS